MLWTIGCAAATAAACVVASAAAVPAGPPAQRPPIDAKAPVAMPAQSFSLSGRIVSVDYAMNVIVVHAHGSDQSVVITPNTVVEHAGEGAGVSDLRPGEHVTVSGVTRAGSLTAVTIIIK